MAEMLETISVNEVLRDSVVTPLTCPACNGCVRTSTEHDELVCLACDRAFAVDPRDGFHAFYDLAPMQNRSLLSDEEPILNPAMTSFGVPLTVHTIREALRKCQPKTVLDIGCGNGGYADALSGLYTSYFGLEPSVIPTSRRMANQLGENVILVHNDPSRPLPVTKNSFDLVMFLASYDHIPNRNEVVARAWDAVKPFGFMLITMTNYGFWAKRMLNFILGREVAKQEHDHFCVHNPQTLEDEVLSSGRIGEVFWCEADNIYVPNSRAQILYQSRLALTIANWLLRHTVNSVLRKKHAGSTMTVVFRKLPVPESSL